MTNGKKDVLARKFSAATEAGRVGKGAEQNVPGAKKQMSEGQRAYEERRARKAGMSLEKWLAQKEKAQREAAREQSAATEQRSRAKKPGLFARLLERAQRPLGSG